MSPIANRGAVFSLISALLAAIGVLCWGAIRDAGPPSPTCPPPLRHWDTPATGKTGQEIEVWIDVRGHNVFWNDTPVTLDELTEFARHNARMTPSAYLKFDPSRAADCRLATKVRDIIAADSACQENNCWQGSRASFARARWHPDKPFAMW